MKLLTVVGARPQFIKAAMFSRAVRDVSAQGGNLMDQIVHTGQHYDDEMSSSFFSELEIPDPVVNLGIHGGTHGEMTGAMLPRLEREIDKRSVDVVVVIGDTNSTMAGALAAAKLNIPVAHVEAGMRHYDREIPEEINRVVTDHVSEYLFCSSDVSAQNLDREGLSDRVHVTGDISYDIFLHQQHKRVPSPYESPYVVATVHRAANTDEAHRLRGIVEAMEECPFPVVLPLHPRTKEALAEHGIEVGENVVLTDPVSWGEMIGLIEGAEFVMTDSGGLQKEAYFCGKRCITLSEVSPWRELVELDANRLAGADSEEIMAAFEWAHQPLDTTAQPYGDGTAARQMVRALVGESTAD